MQNMLPLSHAMGHDDCRFGEVELRLFALPS
jgi:hypothetical protein